MRLIKSRYNNLVFIAVAWLFSSAVVHAGCLDDAVAPRDEGYSLCYLQCVASIPNSLACYWQNSYCRRQCAGVEDDCPVSNPIALSTGAKLQNEKDYEGTGPFPLRIERRYNSSINHGGGEFGPRWAGFADAEILLRNNLLTVKTARGRTLQFEWVAPFNGTTTPLKTNTQESLTAFNYEDAQILELNYKDGSQEVYAFNLADYQAANNRFDARLRWVRGQGNQRHLYNYDDQTGRLASVADEFGNSLRFTYTADGSGKIASITVPGDAVYRYRYNAQTGNLAQVLYPDATPADDSDNPGRIYHYDNPEFRHALTGISGEDGTRYATYAYDAEGKAVLSEHAGGADRLEVLSYDTNEVTTRNALGKQTVYNFEDFGEEGAQRRQLTRVDGIATQNCAASNTTTTYDANGYPASRTDKNGNVTNFAHNARGLEVSRTEAAGTAEERVIATEWHPTFNLPARITEPDRVIEFTYDNAGRQLTRTEKPLL